MARILTFVLGVALGAAAGFAAGIVAAPTVPTADDVAGSERGGAPDTTDRVPAAAGDAPQDRRGEHRVRRGGADSLAAIDAGDIGAVATGTGVISGRVIDGEGQGLAGVAVRALPYGDPPSEPLPPTTDPEEELRREIRDTVRRFRWERAWLRSTVTASNGTYRVEGLADRAWRLEVREPGWEFDRADNEGDWSEVRPGATVDYVGSVRMEDELAVAMPDGKPAATARVVWKEGEGQSSNSDEWTPSRSSLRLRPGEWRIHAESGDDEELRSEDVVVSVTKGVPPPAVRLQLRERPGVIVTVGAAGPDGPMRVRLRLVSDASAPAPKGRRSSRREDPEDWAPPTGRVAFLDVDAGRYSLVASIRGGGEIHREPVEIGTDLLRREVPIPAGDHRDWIAVQVLAPDGAVVPQVEFHGGYESAEGSSDGDVECSRLPDGRWRVAHFDEGASDNWGRQGNADADAATKRWVEARSDKWGHVRAAYRAGADREVVLQFAAPAQLVVAVQGTAEFDDEDFSVEVETVATADQEGGESESKSPSDGKATFGPLPARDVDVILHVRDDDWRRTEVARIRTSLAPGANQVALVVPPLQSLRAALPQDLPGDQVSLSRWTSDESRTWIRRESSGPGTVSWKRIPPGRYRLNHDDLGEMWVTIPGPTDVRFTPKPWNAIRFDVDDGSDVHAAGLRTGDIGLALDGTDFENPRQIRALLAAAELKPKSRLTVLRGAQRVDVEIDLSKLGEDLDWDWATR